MGEWWLQPEAIDRVAPRFGLEVVPHVGDWPIEWAIEAMQQDLLKSRWPKVAIEGLVGVPLAQLFDRKGHRIIAKLKVRDFDHLRTKVQREPA